MKNITRALLVATALVCFGFGVVSNASARTYAKEYQPTPNLTGDDPPLGDDPRLLGQGGEDNVVVPEPGTLILLGAGLTGLVAARRKRRQS